jgi:hypothetical protein
VRRWQASERRHLKDRAPPETSSRQFVRAVTRRWPNAVLQFEDFSIGGSSIDVRIGPPALKLQGSAA